LDWGWGRGCGLGALWPALILLLLREIELAAIEIKESARSDHHGSEERQDEKKDDSFGRAASGG
jgi:hypothetical protein